MNMTNKIEEWDIDNLVPYENNVKKHDAKQVSKIATSIAKFGWRGNPIIVDENGVIIAGHGRRLAAIELGMQKVPVLVVKDLSPEKISALRLADNRASISDYDTEMLRVELEDIGLTADINELLDGIYDDKELDFAIADLSVMDESVFRSDLTSIAEEQKEHVEDKIDEFTEKDVGIAKALGFRTINGKYAVYIGRFMASLEAEFKEPSDVAFGEFCKKYVGD